MMVSKKREIIALVLILFASLLVRLHFKDVPLVRDVGMYAYIAQNIIKGDVIYKDLPDTKFPLTYLTWAVVFDSWGDSFQVLRWLTIIWGLGAVFCFYLIAKQIFKAQASLIATLIYALYSPMPAIQGFTSQIENFMILPYMLGCLFFLRFIKGAGNRWVNLVFAGFFSGIALAYKQVAIFQAVLFIGWLLYQGLRQRDPPVPPMQRMKLALGQIIYRSSALLAGFCVPLLLMAAYLASKGAFSAFYFWTIKFVSEYVSVDYRISIIARSLTSLLDIASSNPVLWIAAIAGLIISLFGRGSASFGFLAWWAIGSYLGVLSGGKFFAHYYIQVVPAICLLGVYAFVVVIEGCDDRIQSSQPLRILIYMMAIGGGLLFFNHNYHYLAETNPYQLSLQTTGTHQYYEAKALADYLQSRLKPDDSVYVWGSESSIYFYLGTKAPVKYHFLAIFHWGAPHDLYEDIVLNLTEKKPLYIIKILERPLPPKAGRNLEQIQGNLAAQANWYKGVSVKRDQMLQLADSHPDTALQIDNFKSELRRFKATGDKDKRMKIIFNRIDKLLKEHYREELRINSAILYKRR